MESSLTERATWRDYYELCKPNVVWLMILTAIVGMCMATTGVVPMSIVVAASVGIALCAASAATVNHDTHAAGDLSAGEKKIHQMSDADRIKVMTMVKDGKIDLLVAMAAIEEGKSLESLLA